MLGSAVIAGALCLVTVAQSGNETASGKQARCDSGDAKGAGEAACARPGDVIRDCPDCPELVVVPAGVFRMGSPDSESGRSSAEGPLHSVTLRKPIAVGRYEVTFSEWDACVSAGGCAHKPRDSGWGRGRRPVINVSWDDVVTQYLPWLSQKTGKAYRLLSEAEWEHAARAGTATAFVTGTSLSSTAANFDATSTYADSPKGLFRQRTLEVGSFAPNAFGLYDMHGNVWEWVADCYSDSYDGAPADGSPGLETPGCQRVMRGGSWIDSPRVLRSASRGHVPPDTRFIYRGFRVARGL